MIAINASQSLNEAIEKSGDERLRVKLSTSIDPKDGHAIDVKYHGRCWTKNVTNIIRRNSDKPDINSSVAAEVAAEVEFLSLAECHMLDGNVPNMAELKDAYIDIRSANHVFSCLRVKSGFTTWFADLIDTKSLISAFFNGFIQ